jgi:hypothetical protein
MKKIAQTLLLLLCITNAFAQPSTVNAVIGDESFIKSFGYAPPNQTNETFRIQLHLAYVEELLNNKEVSYLSDEQQKKRKMALQLLHQYWTVAEFPINYDYAERRPCFIDKDGNICAIGYLVAKTTGIEMAQKINAAHQYDYLLEMNDETVTAWAKKNGFTLEECAMIQPSYGPIGGEETKQMPIQTAYGVSSGFVGGLNIGVNILNLSKRSFSNTKTVSYIGLVSGASQIILGLANIKKEELQYGFNTNYVYSYKAQNILSYINIATGTTTLLTSAFNLFLNNRIKNKKTAVNIYSSPGVNNGMNMGIALARSF